MKSLKSKYFYPAYFFAALIFIGASVPASDIKKIRGYNKLFDLLLSESSMHFFGFGIFAGLLCFGFYKVKKPSLPYLGIGMFSLAFGIFIECYQIFLPFRFFGLNDIVSDALGIILFLLLSKLFLVIYKK